MRLKKIKGVKEKILFLMAVGISIGMLFFVITCSLIGYDVKDQCQKAKSEYGGNCRNCV